MLTLQSLRRRKQLTFRVKAIGLSKAKHGALSQVPPFMNFNQKKRANKCIFLKAQFIYYPLVWMLYSRKLNSEIKNSQERCLRIIYNNNLSTFDELLELENCVLTRNWNLKCLAIELFKIFNGISPDIMKDIFPLSTSSTYDTSNRKTFYTTPVQSVYKRSESLPFFTPKIGEFILECIKSIHSLLIVKVAINNESLMAALEDSVEHAFHKLVLCRGCFSSSFYAYL